MATPSWKKGRGKLGPLAPLIGSWAANADSPMGHVACERVFTRFGDGWIRLDAVWRFGQSQDSKAYREVAFFGPDDTGVLAVWSFTIDGKRSQGTLADAHDVHGQAICFEFDMPAGRARQIYWPLEGGAMNWAVEARNAKGWKRFTHHQYTRTG